MAFLNEVIESVFLKVSLTCLKFLSRVDRGSKYNGVPDLLLCAVIEGEVLLLIAKYAKVLEDVDLEGCLKECNDEVEPLLLSDSGISIAFASAADVAKKSLTNGWCFSKAADGLFAGSSMKQHCKKLQNSFILGSARISSST